MKSIINPYLIADKLAEIGEDCASIIPAIYHSNSIYFIDKCMYYYRFNPKSATKSHKVFNWNNPIITAKHITDCIDIKRYDFKEQIDRKLVHDTFNVCVTQFYSNKSYKKNRQIIISNIKRKIYANAIKSAFFSQSLKANLMLLSLRRRFIFLIYLYSLMK